MIFTVLLQIRDNYRYDDSTGAVFKKVDNIWTPIKAHTQQGYFRTYINRKIVRVHRLCWFLYYGKWPETQIDHINNIRSDNRICNLRLAYNNDNNRNLSTRKIGPFKKHSKFKGVSKDSKGRYRARIYMMGKEIYLGSFVEEIDAAIAYNDAAKIHHGEFAKLNIII